MITKSKAAHAAMSAGHTAAKYTSAQYQSRRYRTYRPGAFGRTPSFALSEAAAGSPSKGQMPDANRRVPTSNQAYLLLLLWVLLVLFVTDGLAAVVFHVG